MNNNFTQFLDKLIADRGEDEAVEFLTNMAKFGAAELYTAMITLLTDEDLAAIEKIEDDAKAQEEVERRFKLHTGLTPEEFVTELRNAVAMGYLELKKNKT